MLGPADSRSGGMLMTLDLFWIASIGVPAAMRPITGTATGRALSSSGAAARTRPRLPSITLGTKPRARALVTPWATELGQPDHLDGAGPVRQAADEAALLERGDQAVNAGLGAQVERFLHLVEGGRHAGLLEPLVDEAEQFVLLARQHRPGPPKSLCPTILRTRTNSGLGPPAPKSNAAPKSTAPKQIMNGHYPFHMCSATL